MLAVGLRPMGPVAEAFEAIAAEHRPMLFELREMILERAMALPEVGPLAEELRWGQPAYLTPKTRMGTTLRLGVSGDAPALFVHCQTDLIERFKSTVGAGFETSGQRAVLFRRREFPRLPVQHLIGWALTYHGRGRT